MVTFPRITGVKPKLLAPLDKASEQEVYFWGLVRGRKCSLG
jgi:hypothetical protein